MAKIVLAFTRLSKDYNQNVADALIRDLDGLVQKLNSTFQQDLKEETQRLTWFSTGGSSG